jgi:hypothetical protein
MTIGGSVIAGAWRPVATEIGTQPWRRGQGESWDNHDERPRHSLQMRVAV